LEVGELTGSTARFALAELLIGDKYVCGWVGKRVDKVSRVDVDFGGLGFDLWLWTSFRVIYVLFDSEDKHGLRSPKEIVILHEYGGKLVDCGKIELPVLLVQLFYGDYHSIARFLLRRVRLLFY
jgi:hypothetical protein